jgi:hypothetical protein
MTVAVFEKMISEIFETFCRALPSDRHKLRILSRCEKIPDAAAPKIAETICNRETLPSNLALAVENAWRDWEKVQVSHVSVPERRCPTEEEWHRSAISGAMLLASLSGDQRAKAFFSLDDWCKKQLLAREVLGKSFPPKIWDCQDSGPIHVSEVIKTGSIYET